jgi:hypothetical protein
MWRMAVVFLVVASPAGSVRAELCAVAFGEVERAERAAPCERMGCASDDFVYHWRAAWLGWSSAAVFVGVDETARACWGGRIGGGYAHSASGGIDSAGEAIDRWWYVYLDEQRYRFLDRTQYLLLGGPSDWRWRYGLWPDVYWPAAPIRYGHAEVRSLPEPWTATLLVLGAPILLRLRPPAKTRRAIPSAG